MAFPRTRVVNLRCGDAYDVYIGRAGHGQTGYFGNPVRRNARCPVCGDLHETPASTIPCFARYFEQRVDSDPEYRAQVLALHGKTLGCFCAPARCHGDIIAAWTDAQARDAAVE